MSDLGVFGGTVAEELDELTRTALDADGKRDVHGCGMARHGRHGAGASSAAGRWRAMAWQPRRQRRWPRHARWQPMAKRRRSSRSRRQPAAPRDGRSRPSARKFADTALWVGALTTDKDGTAEVSLDMPENLTTWRIKVWGMGHGTRVGQGQTDVVTRKDLIVRLQAPRFFVQTDEVVLSANVHNYLKTKKTVKVQLELTASALQLSLRTSDRLRQTVHAS